MSSIKLSKEHGLNPSLEICQLCGKEMGIILFGSSYKDENGKYTKAPHKVCSGGLCSDCKKVIEEGGIFLIEIRDGESGSNPFRTGRYCAIKEDCAKRIFDKYGKINFIEQSLYSQLINTEEKSPE